MLFDLITVFKRKGDNKNKLIECQDIEKQILDLFELQKKIVDIQDSVKDVDKSEKNIQIIWKKYILLFARGMKEVEKNKQNIQLSKGVELLFNNLIIWLNLIKQQYAFFEFYI